MGMEFPSFDHAGKIAEQDYEFSMVGDFPLRIKKWRPYVICLIFLVLFSVLVVRLLQIQVVEPHDFGLRAVDLVAKAREQQHQTLLVDSGRGTIYDRHGEALTGERNYRVVVFPFSQYAQTDDQVQLDQLATILGWTKEGLLQQWREIDQPQTLRSAETGEAIVVTEAQAVQIEALAVPGIHAFYSEGDRYAMDRPAHHLLGTIGRDRERLQDHLTDEVLTEKRISAVGLRGLEASFDTFLRHEGAHRLTYAVDGSGHPLYGKKTEAVNTLHSGGDEAKSLVTTLDTDLQRMVERAMDDPNPAFHSESGIERITDGAAVVLDISNGDVLAMVSRPLETASDAEWPGWVNRALMPMEPGSIFKTVVAAAALDMGIVSEDDEFHCDGMLDVYNVPCWTLDQGGHGTISFADAYAESCNVVFAQLAADIGGEGLEDYAKKLGLGQKVSWTGSVYHDEDFMQLHEEQAGQIFHPESTKSDGFVLAQTGIGQRDVRVTPLQAANMVVSLFHPGELLHPRVVSDIQYANGDPYFHFVPRSDVLDVPIKEEVLTTIRELMTDVVSDGTATAGLSEADWSLGGKTGTAQISDTGKENHWVIGYGPAENPQYAVAVVNRAVSGHHTTHLDVFRTIMDGLAR